MMRYSVLLIAAMMGIGTKSQTFVKSIIGPASVRAERIINTADGGHAIVGSTISFGAGIVDAFILRLNGDGDTLWTRSFGTAQDEFGLSVLEHPDGGFLINGTGRFGASSNKAFLLKMNADGTHAWTKRYAGSSPNIVTGFTSMALTPDGGTVQVGIQGPLGFEDLFVVRTVLSGDTAWGRLFDWNGDVEIRSVATVPSGGSIMTGLLVDDGGHMLLHRLDDLGNVLWSRTFSGLGSGNEVQPTPDGGFVVVGNYNSSAFLLKTDDQGHVEWMRLYNAGSGNSARGTGVRRTSDGGYILSGTWEQTPWLVRADAAGDLLWMHTYASNAFGTCVAENSDGGYTMAAYSSLPSPAPMWMVRTDANGDVPCLQDEPMNGGQNEIPTVEVEFPFTVDTAGTVSMAVPVVGSGASITTYCSTVGIGEPSPGIGVNIHPNPATDGITVRLSGKEGAVAYLVRDALGRAVLRGVLERKEAFIDMNSLRPGTYSLGLESGIVSRFIKL